MASASSMDMVDVLGELLQAEQSGVFHFMAQAGPYISRAAAELRRPIRQIITAQIRREGELVSMLGELGATPRPTRVSSEHQYLAFLSIEYLLPRLREAKRNSIASYERAQQLLGDGGVAAEILQLHAQEHRQELEALERAAAGRSGSGKAGGGSSTHAQEPAAN